jgi:3',5'-nucleoside bisphosphate phosphatase
VPGYEPFLLCDFHVHTRWSDGRLSLRETIDLYGRTGKFDVIAITDHILMKRDLLARAGRVATLGRHSFGVAEDQFAAYLEDIARESARARREYDLLVVPGAEITQNTLRGKKNAHIIALDIKRYISADQSPTEILKEIRRQGALSVACHPHHRAVRRLEISTCYLWDHRSALASLVDVWEAANRTICSRSRASSIFRTSRAATSTNPNISTRGKRCCAPRKSGLPFARRCARTWTSH